MVRRLVVAVLVVAIAYAVVQQLALRSLRDAEASYIDGRQVTACATRELAPFAEERRDLDELPEALEDIIVRAADEAAAVRDGAPGGGIPPARAAVRHVRAALEAEVALYRAMLTTPEASDDELRDLGRANARAERALRSARRWLLVGEPKGWDGRHRCAS